MKAVIVEIKGTYAAVLSDDGCITRVANNNYAIGQVIEMKQKNARSARRKIIAIATSATAVFALFSIGAWAYFTPYYYVSLDVNPSIEYSVNRFEKVIGTKAVNEDGADVLGKLNVQYEDIDEAVKDTINQIATEGYFSTTEQGGIVIATSCSNDAAAEKLALKIRERAQECINEAGITADIETISVGRERVIEAMDLGVTPGKLNLVEKLRDSSTDPSSIVIKDWLDKPVKDIMKAIKDNNSANKPSSEKVNKSDNANDSNSDSSGSSNKSTNANDSNSTTPGSSNKSDSANDSNSTTPGSSNKSDKSNDSNAPSSSNSGNKSDTSKSGFSSNGSKSKN